MSINQLPWVDESETARLYPEIFHYTSENSLDPILSSGGLYATRVDHESINDPNELRALKDIFLPLMQMSAKPLLEYARSTNVLEIGRDSDFRNLFQQDSMTFYNTMIDAFPFVPRVTCFCAHILDYHYKNGLLTMWRAYGAGNGIALGFDTSKLIGEINKIEKSDAASTIALDPIMYSHEDNRYMKRILDSTEIFQWFATNASHWLQKKTERGPILSKDAFEKFFVLSCGTKLPDFRDEREVRLFVAGEHKEFDQKSEEFPPMIVLKYLKALKYIMIGPRANAKDQRKSEIRIKKCLKKFGLPKVEIRHSNTKFRFPKKSASG